MSDRHWVLFDEEGHIQSASAPVKRDLVPRAPADLGMPGILRKRPDVAGAMARRAGTVRVGLGEPPHRLQYDVAIEERPGGVMCVFSEASDPEFATMLEDWAEGTAEGVVLLDADAHVLWSNPAFVQQSGYSEGEIQGRDIGVFLASSSDGRKVATMWASLLGRGQWTGQLWHRRSDGTEFPVRVSASTIRSNAGAITHYLALMTDASQTEELHRLDEVEVATTLVGRLALGFAHDINNLAGEMLGNVEYALTSDDPASGGTALERMEELALAVGEVGRQLLVLGEQGSPDTPADINQVARDLGWLLVRASRPTRTVNVTHGTEPVWVNARADAMIRCLAQPALRALADLPIERVITVSAGCDGERGVVRVTYDGDSTERARLRQLFGHDGMTTFTGNVLRTRAMAHGVELAVEAADALSLIASAPCAVRDPARPAVERPPEQWKSLLVVEDNEPLRELIVQAMSVMFETIHSAGDGLAGFELLEDLGGAVDLVIVDLMMPRMRGDEFVVRTRERWPDARIIVITGGAEDGMTRDVRNAGALDIVFKPFKMRDLRRVVIEALAE